MNYRQLSGYIILVLIVAGVAFTLDIYTAEVGVTFAAKTVLNDDGTTKSIVETIYPLKHQILGLVINFLYGLAAAIFITVFVANKLQRAQHDEKQEELSKLHDAININVFDSLFKTIIPEEIFKVIKQEIIENKVVRREAKWIYDFTQKEEKIICRMTTRYELHNLSQKEVVNPISLSMDPLGGDEYKIIEAECHDCSGNKLVSFDPENEGNNKNINISEEGSKTTVDYAVTIPPETYVEYKTVLERSYVGDITDAQNTKVPVIGADIIVNFPEEYNFDIFPTMSTTPRLITRSNIQKIYRVDGGILPYQGFMFYLVKDKG